MANMTKMLLIVFIIHFVLVIFQFSDVPGFSLYEMIKDPSDIKASDFYNNISDLLLGLGAFAIVVGTFIVGRDLAIFAGVTAILLSFVVSLGDVWVKIGAQTNDVIATFIVGPIIIIYILTAVAFWRAKAD